jgi:LmbE family N-acetylglucosaminyl deacetylase
LTSVLAIARETSELAALTGGTLAKLADREGRRFIAEVRFPSPGVNSEARDRLGEGVAGAVAAEWLGSVAPEDEVDGRTLRDPVMDVIRRARPDIIIVSASDLAERLPLAELVFNAAYCSTIPNYLSPTGLEAASVRAPILMMDSPSERYYEPDSYVDISEQWPVKLGLLKLCNDAGARSDLTDLAEISSRARGVQVQVEFAEAFRFEPVWGRLRPYRVLP